MLDGFEKLFRIMVITLIIFVPLGLWKLIELLRFAFTHISFTLH